MNAEIDRLYSLHLPKPERVYSPNKQLFTDLPPSYPTRLKQQQVVTTPTQKEIDERIWHLKQARSNDEISTVEYYDQIEKWRKIRRAIKRR